MTKTKKTTPTRAKLDDLTLDPDFMVRDGIDLETCQEYAADMQEGDVFPPLTVYQIGGALVLVDGWHRYQAAQRAGFVELDVVIKDGTREEAIAEGIRANTKHGRRYTNTDKRRAVTLAWSTWPDMSARSIARLCAVSPDFAARLAPGKASSTDTGAAGPDRKNPDTDAGARDAERAERETLDQENKGTDRERPEDARHHAAEGWDLYLANVKTILDALDGLAALDIEPKNRNPAKAMLQNIADKVAGILAKL